MPTLLHEHTRSPVASANALETAASLQIHRGLLPPSLTGSSAFPEQSNQIRRNRYDVPLNNRSFRRPFYNSTSTSVARGITSDPIAIPWKDAEDNTMQQSHRKQRTSPRRRLADSKVRAQAFQMREESEAFNHIEAKHLGYGLAEINRYEGAPTSFAPPFSAVSRRLPLPMSQSPIYFDSSITKCAVCVPMTFTPPVQSAT
ncbi:unnamed protein product [Peronospora belbahrii]|uniref:Uncharacterized protein n=1 Tax=Peronospora belbahrii TaxID=622444 RepID=A0ABN8CJK5_9STRA|nr:unnamed protein product [Peronospora belbahrii]